MPLHSPSLADTSKLASKLETECGGVQSATMLTLPAEQCAYAGRWSNADAPCARTAVMEGDKGPRLPDSLHVAGAHAAALHFASRFELKAVDLRLFSRDRVDDFFTTERGYMFLLEMILINYFEF